MQKLMGTVHQKLLDTDNNIRAAISAGTLSAVNIFGDTLKSRSEIDELKGTMTSLKDKARLAKSTVVNEYFNTKNKVTHHN